MCEGMYVKKVSLRRKKCVEYRWDAGGGKVCEGSYWLWEGVRDLPGGFRYEGMVVKNNLVRLRKENESRLSRESFGFYYFVCVEAW